MMLDTRYKVGQVGTVLVDGKLFARYALTAADAARDYGATLSLKIWPVLDGQGEPGWFETYTKVQAAIHDYLGRQN